MRNNYVQLFRTEQRIRRVRDGWSLRPHGRLAWLHTLLWKCLVRLNALSQSFVEEVDTLRLPISNDEVFHRILEARDDLFQNHRRPRRILIGPKTLGELIGCEELRSWPSAFQFHAEAGFNRTLFDLPIEVVPQMEGVVVLCDDAVRA